MHCMSYYVLMSITHIPYQLNFGRLCTFLISIFSGLKGVNACADENIVQTDTYCNWINWG